MEGESGNLSLYVGYVSGVTDEYAGGRIRAIISKDKGLSLNDIPYAFPCLPKLIHVKPKNGEAVIVLVSNDKKSNGQRYYIGPIISQPDKMNLDTFSSLSATRLLWGGITLPQESIENNGESLGAMPKDNEIALLGRKNTDIILSEDDVRIRAGVRLTDPENKVVKFNRESPAFIKLKHHDPILKTNETETGETLSTATIVADKINLISQNGNEHFETSDTNESISDNEISRIIEKAYRVPYGEVLVEFIMAFMKMYEGHFHADCGMPPSHIPDDKAFFDAQFGTKEKLEKEILSQNIRIS